MKRLPELDGSSIGVSFVDLLFALAVAQVFAPVAEFATNPADHPLDSTSISHLIVALTMTIMSWIGYHASANKPRFRPHFFNIELVKLILDIAMVAVYFLVAANAVRPQRDSRIEIALVAAAFTLYQLWDIASWYQKRGDSNKYRAAWLKAYPPEPPCNHLTPEWSATDTGRMMATSISFFATAALAVLSFSRLGDLMANHQIGVDAILMIILVGYRWLKEVLAADLPAQTAAVDG
jgi:hypothetical protein